MKTNTLPVSCSASNRAALYRTREGDQLISEASAKLKRFHWKLFNVGQLVAANERDLFDSIPGPRLAITH